MKFTITGTYFSHISIIYNLTWQRLFEVRSIDALTYATVSTLVNGLANMFCVPWLIPLFSNRLIDLLASSTQTATGNWLACRHLYFAVDACFSIPPNTCSIKLPVYGYWKCLVGKLPLPYCGTFWHRMRDTTVKPLVAWGPKMWMKESLFEMVRISPPSGVLHVLFSSTVHIVRLWSWRSYHTFNRTLSI